MNAPTWGLFFHSPWHVMTGLVHFSPDRSRTAEDSGDLRVLHQQTTGAAAGTDQSRGSCGRVEPAALRRGGHLQQTLPGSPVQWSVSPLFTTVQPTIL